MQSLFALGRLILRQPSFAGLLAANFALGLAYSFVVPFMSLWGTLRVGMTAPVFGLFMTTTSLCAIVLSTILARWSDTHLARKTLLLLGGAGGVLGYVGYAFLRDPIVLVIVGSTALAVASVNFSQLFSLVREMFEGAEQQAIDPSFLVSVVRVCFSIAWTVGPAIGAVVMANYSYRGVFLGAAALYFVFLIGVICFVPYQPRQASNREATRPPLWQVLTRRHIMLSFIAFVAVFAAHTMNMMNLPLRVTEDLGGNTRDLGIIFGIGPVAEIPLMLWFGHLAARGHQLFLIRLGTALTVVYFFALSFAREPWQIYPIQILSGVSFAILTNVTILFYQDLLPGQTGLATTIFSNSSNLGSLIGYFVFGSIVGPLGHRGIFLACGALTIVTFLILLFYRDHSGNAAPGNSAVGARATAS